MITGVMTFDAKGRLTPYIADLSFRDAVCKDAFRIIGPKSEAHCDWDAYVLNRDFNVHDLLTVIGDTQPAVILGGSRIFAVTYSEWTHCIWMRCHAEIDFKLEHPWYFDHTHWIVEEIQQHELGVVHYGTRRY